jgi:hypothetical protein
VRRYIAIEAIVLWMSQPNLHFLIL